MSDEHRSNTDKMIQCLGGLDNIMSVTNCMTRVRAVVRDESLVDEEKIRSVGDVLGLVHDRAQYYEIVVGPGKSRKYADLFREMGADRNRAVSNPD